MEAQQGEGVGAEWGRAGKEAGAHQTESHAPSEQPAHSMSSLMAPCLAPRQYRRRWLRVNDGDLQLLEGSEGGAGALGSREERVRLGRALLLASSVLHPP